MPLLHITDLRKSFAPPGGERSLVVDVRELALEAGEELALAGASGSGKTTFLHLVAGILAPDHGRILIEGRDMAALSEPQRDRLRARSIGIVFQTFHLLPGYSALENVLLGSMFGAGADPRHARELLARLGLEHRLRHKPRQLSVGQQQRVALARALVGRPKLLLADEPTGSLDPARAEEAIELLRSLCAEEGTAVVLVSHDPAVLARFPRVLRMEDLSGAARAAGGGA